MYNPNFRPKSQPLAMILAAGALVLPVAGCGDPPKSETICYASTVSPSHTIRGALSRIINDFTGIKNTDDYTGLSNTANIIRKDLTAQRKAEELNTYSTPLLSDIISTCITKNDVNDPNAGGTIAPGEFIYAVSFWEDTPTEFKNLPENAIFTIDQTTGAIKDTTYPVGATPPPRE